jgi:hypothetical protein
MVCKDTNHGWLDKVNRAFIIILSRCAEPNISNSLTQTTDGIL